jgi:predicted nucleic acid-binding protein
MNVRKGLVLDANILVRAVFGTHVRSILESFEDTASFFSPDVCFEDALEYIPVVAARRGIDATVCFATLDAIGQIVESVDRSLYETHEQLARERVSPRDPDDWPVAAVALLLELPIWTEDQDFFGIGLVSWTTDKVQLYLRAS